MTKRTRRLLWIGIPVAVVLVGLSAIAPLVYFTRSIDGKIVDAETGQPLEGAVIVARWVPFLWGLGDSGHAPYAWRMAEVVTNGKGEYHICPRWPILRWPPYATLADWDPLIKIFKTGYEPRGVANNLYHPSNRMVRTSEWNGKTIALKPFRGTPQERLSQLDNALAVGGERRRRGTVKLYDEILKEKPALGHLDPAFFANVQELREGQ